MPTIISAPPRARSVAAWALQVLLAALFVMFGVRKWAGGDAITASFEEIGAGQWLRYATGTTEILGGLALLCLPLAGLAAAALAAQMVGAALTQVVFVEDGSPVLPIVLGCFALAVAWLRRDRSVETTQRLRLRLLAATR